MSKTTVLFAMIPVFAVMMAVFAAHYDFGRKWIMRKVIGPLQNWIPVQGTVQEIKFNGGAGTNKFWKMTYTFSLADGRTFTAKASGHVPNLSSLPYYTGQGIPLLVDPANPEHSRLINELRQHAFCVPLSDELKSVKRVQIEFAVDCLVVLACTVAACVFDPRFSDSPGGLVMADLLVGSVLIGCGMLQMLNNTPGKLLGK